MKHKHILLALTLGVMVVGCANVERSRDLANPAVPGSVIAVQVCSNCHGIDGNSTSPAFPRLAAQQSLYLANQLQNFRGHHQRSDPAGTEYMWGLSQHLTDEQITGIAEYFSKQKALPNAHTDPTLAAAGKEIFEKGIPKENVIACSSCHGPTAQGVATFPRLANQHADYIVKQLNIFQNTQGRPGTPMELVSHGLTGGNKDAVAAYLQDFPN
jgi:cytochrome c553